MIRLVSESLSDVGRVRQMNQDNAFCRDDLVVVADGMGGHQGGEVASAVAVEILESRRDQLIDAQAYVTLIEEANAAILERAADDDSLAGMGTTVVALGILTDVEDSSKSLVMVNVGDSRGYRFRDGELAQITEDHNLVSALLREGKITEDEARHHPNRNVVTRALGIDPGVLVDMWEFDAAVGDRYLLCSDGLFDELVDAQIESVLRRLDDLGEASAELVRLANDAGGRDNVTVVLAEIVDDIMVSGDGSETSDGDLGDESDPVVWRSEQTEDEPPKTTRSWFSWRVAVFLVLLAAVVAVTLGALGVYARGGYFVGFEDESVVIYKGRPDGVLWINPTVEERTGVAADDLVEADRADVEAEHELDSLAQAERLVEAISS
jgi:serine/threonine protein phosphatase PrpC